VTDVEEEREQLEAELAKCTAAIDKAYWLFSRTLSPKVPPPSSQVPWAYTRRREIKERLRELKEE